MADILHRVGIKAKLGDVYKALATRDGVAGWWSSDTQGEGKVGGSLILRFTSAGVEIGRFELEVLELHPDREVLWQVVGGPADWIGTRIGFGLKQEGEYTVVLFKHQGWKEPSESMHHCSTKWAIFLMSLKQLVETGRGAPSPDDIKIDNWN